MKESQRIVQLLLFEWNGCCVGSRFFIFTFICNVSWSVSDRLLHATDCNSNVINRWIYARCKFNYIKIFPCAARSPACSLSRQLLHLCLWCCVGHYNRFNAMLFGYISVKRCVRFSYRAMLYFARAMLHNAQHSHTHGQSRTIHFCHFRREFSTFVRCHSLIISYALSYVMACHIALHSVSVFRIVRTRSHCSSMLLRFY